MSLKRQLRTCATVSRGPRYGANHMRLPDSTQRIVIIGRTGSGKTQAGAWHLSTRDLTEEPWVIIDYKRDRLLNSIWAKEITLKDKVPDEPGLYTMHPRPIEDDSAVEDYC